MKLRDRSNHHSVKLILNASLDALLLKTRAKALNNAGYYTSSAHSSEEVVRLASGMHCDLAVICHSFGDVQQKRIEELLRKVSPGTRVLFLDSGLEGDDQIFLALIQQALGRMSA